jgi:hypothetical protein
VSFDVWNRYCHCFQSHHVSACPQKMAAPV